MGLSIFGKRGATATATGAENEARIGPLSELIVAQGLPELYIPNIEGNVWYAPAASVAMTDSAIDTSPPLNVYNPEGSGVNLVMVVLNAAYRSGTFAAGSLNACTARQTTAPSGGTAITPVAGKAGNTGVKASAGTGQTVATLTDCGPIAQVGAFAGGSGVAIQPCDIDLKGRFVIPPGYVFAIAAKLGTGTSPVADLVLGWVEVPVV